MPPRKKKNKDDEVPLFKAKAKSGWCLTADHKRCPNNFVYSECSCSCHKKK